MTGRRCSIAGIFTIFCFTLLGQWTRVGQDINGEMPYDNMAFSSEISGDGNRLAVGAPGARQDSGLVKVFDWNGLEWVQIGQDIVGESPSSYLGVTLSISEDGSRLAVGAPYHNMQAGRVQIFEFDGTNWIQLGTNLDGLNAGENFGSGLDLSKNGQVISVGASLADDVFMDGGAVTCYVWDGMD